MGKLDLNKIEDLTRLRGEIDKVISEHISKCEKNTIIDSIPSLEFHKIKNIFESISPSLISDKNGAVLVRKYIKLMKENECLKTACGFHKLVNESHSFVNSDMLLNEALTISKSSNKLKNLEHSVKKLGDIVAECVKVSDISPVHLKEIISENSTISESVDYLLLNEKTFKNINEYLNNFSAVSSFMSENINKVDESVENLTTEDAIEKLSENINSLDEPWEKALMEDITLMYLSNGKESDLFGKYVNECVNTIDVILTNENDITTLSNMKQMKEQLNNKHYVKENFSVDIKNLAELNHTLKETIIK